MTVSQNPTPRRRLLVSAGLVSADGSESSPIVRGQVTRFTLGMALLYLASAVVAWVAYAAKTTSMPLAVPAFWTLAAVVLVATSIRRAR